MDRGERKALMLESINLHKTMMLEEYKPEIKILKEKMEVLQQTVKEAGLPVIIVVEGWSASGKGKGIAKLIESLDPRNFKVHSTVAPTTEEKRKPFLWRHWSKIPVRGQLAIFDRSWYQDVLIAVEEDHITEEQILQRADSIKTFEKQLTDDGYLIIKLFLHISQKEQTKRLKSLASNKDTAWRVTEKDWKKNERYENYYNAFDGMLQYTNTEYAPWHVLSSHDKRFKTVEMYKVVVESIEEALKAKKVAETPVEEVEENENEEIIPVVASTQFFVENRFSLVKMPKLSDINLDKMVEEERYKQVLKEKQKRLSVLHNRLYHEKVPVVIVYEGWDAGGKGGNIKRISEALDPRGYEVIPVAAPNKFEFDHHYLWRFWKQLPKTGHFGIYDRSWYGRLMVERIEGFCKEEDWKRAYQEINEFEKELHDWGAIILKFWLHISPEEQLARFTDRMNTPEKQWKITDEDWRNREKWPAYEEAVNDMIQYTSTDFAPWTIIEGNDKRFARLKAITTLIDTIESAL